MLRIILSGIAKNYPTCNRIGIVGGVYEDEVAHLANAVQSAGFDTTIVKRYCMSEKIFTNLDEMLRTMDEAARKMILDERGSGVRITILTRYNLSPKVPLQKRFFRLPFPSHPMAWKRKQFHRA